MRCKSHSFKLAALISLSLFINACASDNDGATQTAIGADGNITPSESQRFCASMDTWPDKQLEAIDAMQVDSTQFISADVLRTWAIETDAAGLRATANKAHDAYIDRLAARLKCAGVENVYTEDVPITR